MPLELTILIYAALLLVAQIALMVVYSAVQSGISYGAGPRDITHPFTGISGRADRALTNHYAALALFTIAVIAVTLGNQSTSLTENAAWAFLIARILYVPAYLSGVPFLRTVLWIVGAGASVTMLIVALA